MEGRNFNNQRWLSYNKKISLLLSMSRTYTGEAEVQYSFTHFQRNTRRRWVVEIAPLPFHPRERTLVPFTEGLVGPQSPSERFWRSKNLLPLPLSGFELCTIHPVASRYIKYTIPVPIQSNTLNASM